jgi:cytochrome b561
VRLRNTAEDWGVAAKLLHWAGVVLTLAMLGLGLVMVHAGLASAPKFEAYQLHKNPVTSAAEHAKRLTGMPI